MNPVQAFSAVSSGGGMLSGIIGLLRQKKQQSHERKIMRFRKEMMELQIVDNSNLRDQFVEQLLLDRFLAPIEKAQFKIQETAKKSQSFARVLGVYYRDHGIPKEKAQEICSEFRSLAVRLTKAESLEELKILYEAITIFAQEISIYRHRKTEYSIEYFLESKILHKLNDCIADYNNFQRRLEMYSSIDFQIAAQKALPENQQKD